MDQAVQASVTMDNSEQRYQFTEAINANAAKAMRQNQRVQRVSIPANSGRSLSFMIRPNRVGLTTLKITAISPLAGDTIHQVLKVEPDGVTKYVNQPVFVSLNGNSRLHRRSLSELEKTLEVKIPPEAVEDSEEVVFQVGANIEAPTLEHLDELVRLPSGCGEQNMFNFVPNILVLRYLDAANRNSPRIAAEAKNFLAVGYQRELTYKHNDGSYSAFGPSDAKGSTWLTAYVIRSFHQAIKYTFIDPNILTAGLDFLAGRQVPSGEFPELGKVFHNDHGNPLALTSYVLLAFFENQVSSHFWH